MRFAVVLWRRHWRRHLSVPRLAPSSLTALCAAQHEKFQSAPGSRVGTPAYLAPEVIMTTKGQTYDGKVRRRAVTLNPKPHKSPKVQTYKASAMARCAPCARSRRPGAAVLFRQTGWRVRWLP